MEKRAVEGRGVEVGNSFFFRLYQRDSAGQAGEIHLRSWISIGLWIGLIELLNC
jgi:hypothetical protein